MTQLHPLDSSEHYFVPVGCDFFMAGVAEVREGTATTNGYRGET
jgi:hypothetical protein